MGSATTGPPPAGPSSGAQRPLPAGSLPRPPLPPLFLSSRAHPTQRTDPARPGATRPRDPVTRVPFEFVLVADFSPFAVLAEAFRDVGARRRRREPREPGNSSPRPPA